MTGCSGCRLEKGCPVHYHYGNFNICPLSVHARMFMYAQKAEHEGHGWVDPDRNKERGKLMVITL